jgi:hypothetical protein
MMASLAIQGCSSIGEPLGLKPGTLGMFDPTRAEEMSNGAPEAGIESHTGPAVPAVIVIGRVRLFEAMPTEESESIYRRQYLTFVQTWENPREPTLSMEEFVSTISGFCRVSLWSTPVIEISMDALVPVDIVDRIQYPGILDMLFWTGVGDLVAARTNDDGVLIVQRILCSEGSGYRECSKSYGKGFFDATTGRELSYRGKVKKDGLIVDTTHYKVVKKE